MQHVTDACNRTSAERLVTAGAPVGTRMCRSCGGDTVAGAGGCHPHVPATELPGASAMTERLSSPIVPSHHHDDDHDDHGGLHRDLLATGGTMGRRRALRMAATWGVGLGASVGAL